MERRAEKDLIDFFALKDTEFYPDFVSHTVTKSPRIRGEQEITTVEQWHRLKELGYGYFGTVWLEQEHSGELRAVKELRKQRQASQSSHYLRELLALASFTRDEANFVGFKGWYEDNERLYIAMQFYELGDLDACVKNPLPEDEARQISSQVTRAIRFMHDQDFTHRDIKPSNILVASKAPNWWIKVADFGISKRVQANAPGLYTPLMGDYVAPEAFNLVDDGSDDDESGYTNAVDLWSLGCLTHWLLTIQCPFPDFRDLKQYCRGRSQFPLKFLHTSNASTGASIFIERLMAPIPRDRWTAKQAQDSKWLQAMYHKPALSSIPRSAPSYHKRKVQHQAQDRPSSISNLTPMRIEDPTLNMLSEGLTTLSAAPNSDPCRFDAAPKEEILIPASKAGSSTLREAYVALEITKNQGEPETSEVKPVEILKVESLHYNKSEATNFYKNPATSENMQPSEQKRNPSKNLILPSVESEVLKSFREFAAAEKLRVSENKRKSATEERAKTLAAFQDFHKDFKMTTPIPPDLVKVLAKDETKQDELVRRQAEIVASLQVPQTPYHADIETTNSNILSAQVTMEGTSIQHLQMLNSLQQLNFTQSQSDPASQLLQVPVSNKNHAEIRGYGNRQRYYELLPYEPYYHQYAISPLPLPYQPQEHRLTGDTTNPSTGFDPNVPLQQSPSMNSYLRPVKSVIQSNSSLPRPDVDPWFLPARSTGNPDIYSTPSPYLTQLSSTAGRLYLSDASLQPSRGLELTVGDESLYLPVALNSKPNRNQRRKRNTRVRENARPRQVKVNAG